MDNYLSTDEEEFDDEGCAVFVDLGIRCGKPISSTVAEPYTPGRFQIECCGDCYESFISQGYRKVQLPLEHPQLGSERHVDRSDCGEVDCETHVADLDEAERIRNATREAA